MIKGFSLVWLVVVIVVLGAAGTGYFLLQSDPDTIPIQNQEPIVEQPEDKSEEKEKEGTVITSGDSQFGTMLFNNDGQAIYIWEVEDSSKAECYDECAEAWPPVLTGGTPQASGDVDGDLLGTTERTDGSIQVTYNDHPLYYYAHENAGEVKCHNVSTHGGLWWVIQPNGVRAE